MRVHKQLYCEECGLKPDSVYGSDLGDACIEVHHNAPLHERSTAGETTWMTSCASAPTVTASSTADSRYASTSGRTLNRHVPTQS